MTIKDEPCSWNFDRRSAKLAQSVKNTVRNFTVDAFGKLEDAALSAGQLLLDALGSF